MKKKGCLIIWIVLFVFIASAFAYSNIFGDDVHSPDYYASNARVLFKQGKWDEGKRLVDEGLKYYPATGDLNELNGQYYYHKKEYDNARYYLIICVRDNPENVTARQLLVSVEEVTKNYSSAICYVNELLEINPYWQGLWRKKIGLFRLQGNDVEADRLLKRLRQIYPNDSTVLRDYAYSLEEKYARDRKAGNSAASIESLYELIDAVPDNADYYLTLANLLLQQGNTEEALQIAGRGASRLPGSSALVLKRASILAGEGRYQEAMAYVKSRMRYNNSSALASFYNGLLSEAAEQARMNDPYVLYGKVYENSKSQESLDYMLNTSLTRGYNEDALYYIAEAKRRRGETFDLLYKEYIVYKRMGNASKAYSLLSTLASMDSTNVDIVDELALNRLHQAGNLISDGLYSEALPYLKAAAMKSHDPDIRYSAMNKEFSCYFEMRKYDDALATLDRMHAISPDDSVRKSEYFVKKTDILNRQGYTSAALAVLDSILRDSMDVALRATYVAAYEEIAVPYIKNLIEEGASYRAYEESSRLLAVNPSNLEALQYAIGMADLLGRYDAYDSFVRQARSIYPERTDFIVKQAATYSRGGEYRRAVDMLRPWLDYYPHNDGLVGAFSDNSEQLAYSLIKDHKAGDAVAVADTALVFDRDNPSLYLAKGVAYESMHRFDSAYYYQKKYKPGAAEAESFSRHLAGLESRSYNNEVSAEYLQGRYGDADVLTSVATLSYSHRWKDDNITARINYAGRDGSAAGEDPEDQVPGGIGLQAQASWEHRLSPEWSGTVTAGVATRYFPAVMAELKAERYFDNDMTLDIHGSFRRINTYSKAFKWVEETPEVEGGWAFDGWDEHKNNLFSFGLGASKTWERLLLSGKLDAYMMSSHIYGNLSAQFKYYPLEDGRTNIAVVGSVGTAPEANMIDNALPGTFDKLNTMVGLGGTYMVNKRLSLGLMGTWHTFYSQLNNRITLDGGGYTDNLTTKYRNLFNIHFQLYVHF